MRCEEKIMRSRGKILIHNAFNEITGEHAPSVSVDKKTGVSLIRNGEVYNYTEDDGVGIIVFYENDPSIVHTLLFAV